MRICLLGYGNIAKKHIEIVRHLGGEIVASCNRSEASNKLAEAEGGIPKTYTDAVEMIKTEKPDGIISCVNFSNIYATTKALIPFKIPILVEKPAGLTVAELKDLIALQEEHKTIVQVALNRRFYTVFHNAVKAIGGTEAIDMIDVEWSERPVRAKQDKGYTDKMVEDLLIANSIHGIDLLNYYSGGIAEYTAFTSSKKSDYYRWNMTLSGVSEKGVLVNFTNSWGSPVPWRVIMYTNDKRFEFAPLEGCKVYSNNADENISVTPEEFDTQFKAGFHNQAESFFNSIKTATENTAHNLQSTMRSMEVAEDLLNKLKLG